MADQRLKLTRVPFRTYTGHRNPRSHMTEVRVIDGHGESRWLPLRLDLYNHSPTGFEWGYGGSGPSQLALAILADVVNDRIAMVLHQAYKRAVIAKLPRDKSWRIKEQDVIENVRTMLNLPHHKGIEL